MSNYEAPSRRSFVSAMTGMALVLTGKAQAEQNPAITVHKDPNCGCCTGWVEHLAKASFNVKTIDTTRLDEVKKRLAVPTDLAACHTAEVEGYVIEGHVPASAIKRFLGERPKASGLAVPGMPIGSPGMEGGEPEAYVVIQFGPEGRKEYMRFVGARPV